MKKLIKKVTERKSSKALPNKKILSQMELELERPFEHDRNHALGGKSFYFFDFDDNVAFLSTPIVLFHKDTGEELFVSSGDFARNHKDIGFSGPYKDFFINLDDEVGSFRHFRDQEFNMFGKLMRKKQNFEHDIKEALDKHDYLWKAPSWNCFYHATFNQRPMSIITARGHQKLTIKKGIKLMVREGHIPHEPNYLEIFPVSNPDVRRELGDIDLQASVPELKRSAIRQSVEKAIQTYGYNPHHRFGMSDDDPKNVDLIFEEMRELKRKYSEMSFFVIHTKKDSFEKHEIVLKKQRRRKVADATDQLALL